jgi:large subunit ribosomal protein L29
MKTSDLRKLTPEELVARVAGARQQVFDLRFKRATGQLPNSASLRAARRDLARALTVQNERRRSG